MNLLKGSFFLKVIALALSLLTYFYIHEIIDRSEKKTIDPTYRLFKPTARNLPIRVRLATAPADGYRIVSEKVTANPAKIFAVAPEVMLDSTPGAETALIDVSQSTSTVIKKIPLDNVAGIPLTGEPYMVEVTIPIEKIE